MILKGEARKVLQLMSNRKAWFGKELAETDRGIDSHNIYVTLPRMAKQGLIDLVEWEQREGTRGLGVKLFKITEIGMQVLRATQAVEENQRQETLRQTQQGAAVAGRKLA